MRSETEQRRQPKEARVTRPDNLSIHRSFVLRLYPGADFDAEEISGRLEHVVSMERAVNPLFSRRDYKNALTQLATLKEDVDRFFDSVMVMADDPDVRANRLGLLVRLRGLFLQVAECAGSKVMPEDLGTTYRKLRAAVEKEGATDGA